MGDGGVDPRDAGAPDSGTPDAGSPDAGPTDAGVVLSFTLPTSIEAGACVPVTLTRAGGGPAAIPVALSASPANLDFFTDAKCPVGAAVTSVSFGLTATTTTFYVHGLSSDSQTVTVTATPTGGAAVTRQAVALPLVRRGRCTIPAGMTTVRCPTPPDFPTDFSRTFLLAQTLTTGLKAMDGTATCALEVPASGPQLACSRFDPTGAVTIGWQTVSHGRSAAAGGWSVRHLILTNLSFGSQTNITLSPSVNRDESFVLSNFSSAGDFWSANDHLSVSLNNLSVNLRSGGPTSSNNRLALQVVEMPGINTRHEVRGSPALPFNSSFPAGDPTQFFTLLSSVFQVTGLSSVPCRYALDVERTATGVTISRTPTAPCSDEQASDLSIQSIAVPQSRVTQGFVSFAPTEVTKPLVLATPVAPHKTVTFLAGLGTSGNSVGGLATATANGPGTVMSLTELTTPTTVVVTRGVADGTLTARPYVVEFSP